VSFQIVRSAAGSEAGSVAGSAGAEGFAFWGSSSINCVLGFRRAGVFFRLIKPLCGDAPRSWTRRGFARRGSWSWGFVFSSSLSANSSLFGVVLRTSVSLWLTGPWMSSAFALFRALIVCVSLSFTAFRCFAICLLRRASSLLSERSLRIDIPCDLSDFCLPC
jgi:hypothetical protein